MKKRKITTQELGEPHDLDDMVVEKNSYVNQSDSALALPLRSPLETVAEVEIFTHEENVNHNLNERRNTTTTTNINSDGEATSSTASGELAPRHERHKVLEPEEEGSAAVVAEDEVLDGNNDSTSTTTGASTSLSSSQNNLALPCLHCGENWCMLCKRAAHPGQTCEAARVNAERMEREVRETCERNGWKKCGGCDAWVERTTGCNHMTCTCGYQFCYECGEEYFTPAHELRRGRGTGRAGTTSSSSTTTNARTTAANNSTTNPNRHSLGYYSRSRKCSCPQFPEQNILNQFDNHNVARNGLYDIYFQQFGADAANAQVGVVDRLRAQLLEHNAGEHGDDAAAVRRNRDARLLAAPVRERQQRVLEAERQRERELELDWARRAWRFTQNQDRRSLMAAASSVVHQGAVVAGAPREYIWDSETTTWNRNELAHNDLRSRTGTNNAASSSSRENNNENVGPSSAQSPARREGNQDQPRTRSAWINDGSRRAGTQTDEHAAGSTNSSTWRVDHAGEEEDAARRRRRNNAAWERLASGRSNTSRAHDSSLGRLREAEDVVEEELPVDEHQSGQEVVERGNTSTTSSRRSSTTMTAADLEGMTMDQLREIMANTLQRRRDRQRERERRQAEAARRAAPVDLDDFYRVLPQEQENNGRSPARNNRPGTTSTAGTSSRQRRNRADRRNANAGELPAWWERVAGAAGLHDAQRPERVPEGGAPGVRPGEENQENQTETTERTATAADWWNSSGNRDAVLQRWRTRRGDTTSTGAASTRVNAATGGEQGGNDRGNNSRNAANIRAGSREVLIRRRRNGTNANRAMNGIALNDAENNDDEDAAETTQGGTARSGASLAAENNTNGYGLSTWSEWYSWMRHDLQNTGESGGYRPRPWNSWTIPEDVEQPAASAQLPSDAGVGRFEDSTQRQHFGEMMMNAVDDNRNRPTSSTATASSSSSSSMSNPTPAPSAQELAPIPWHPFIGTASNEQNADARERPRGAVISGHRDVLEYSPIGGTAHLRILSETAEPATSSRPSLAPSTVTAPISSILNPDAPEFVPDRVTHPYRASTIRDEQEGGLHRSTAVGAQAQLMQNYTVPPVLLRSTPSLPWPPAPDSTSPPEGSAARGPERSSSPPPSFLSMPTLQPDLPDASVIQFPLYHQFSLPVPSGSRGVEGSAAGASRSAGRRTGTENRFAALQRGQREPMPPRRWNDTAEEYFFRPWLPPDQLEPEDRSGDDDSEAEAAPPFSDEEDLLHAVASNLRGEQDEQLSQEEGDEDLRSGGAPASGVVHELLAELQAGDTGTPNGTERRRAAILRIAQAGARGVRTNDATDLRAPENSAWRRYLRTRYNRPRRAGARRSFVNNARRTAAPGVPWMLQPGALARFFRASNSSRADAQALVRRGSGVGSDDDDDRVLVHVEVETENPAAASADNYTRIQEHEQGAPAQEEERLELQRDQNAECWDRHPDLEHTSRPPATNSIASRAASPPAPAVLPEVGGTSVGPVGPSTLVHQVEDEALAARTGRGGPQELPPNEHADLGSLFRPGATWEERAQQLARLKRDSGSTAATLARARRVQGSTTTTRADEVDSQGRHLRGTTSSPSTSNDYGRDIQQLQEEEQEEEHHEQSAAAASSTVLTSRNDREDGVDASTTTAQDGDLLQDDQNTQSPDAPSSTAVPHLGPAVVEQGPPASATTTNTSFFPTNNSDLVTRPAPSARTPGQILLTELLGGRRGAGFSNEQHSSFSFSGFSIPEAQAPAAAGPFPLTGPNTALNPIDLFPNTYLPDEINAQQGATTSSASLMNMIQPPMNYSTINRNYNNSSFPFPAAPAAPAAVPLAVAAPAAPTAPPQLFHSPQEHDETISTTFTPGGHFPALPDAARPEAAAPALGEESKNLRVNNDAVDSVEQPRSEQATTEEQHQPRNFSTGTISEAQPDLHIDAATFARLSFEANVNRVLEQARVSYGEHQKRTIVEEDQRTMMAGTTPSSGGAGRGAALPAEDNGGQVDGPLQGVDPHPTSDKDKESTTTGRGENRNPEQQTQTASTKSTNQTAPSQLLEEKLLHDDSTISTSSPATAVSATGETTASTSETETSPSYSETNPHGLLDRINLFGRLNHSISDDIVELFLVLNENNDQHQVKAEARRRAEAQNYIADLDNVGLDELIAQVDAQNRQNFDPNWTNRNPARRALLLDESNITRYTEYLKLLAKLLHEKFLLHAFDQTFDAYNYTDLVHKISDKLVSSISRPITTPNDEQRPRRSTSTPPLTLTTALLAQCQAHLDAYKLWRCGNQSVNSAASLRLPGATTALLAPHLPEQKGDLSEDGITKPSCLWFVSWSLEDAEDLSADEINFWRSFSKSTVEELANLQLVMCFHIQNVGGQDLIPAGWLPASLRAFLPQTSEPIGPPGGNVTRTSTSGVLWAAIRIWLKTESFIHGSRGGPGVETRTEAVLRWSETGEPEIETNSRLVVARLNEEQQRREFLLQLTNLGNNSATRSGTAGVASERVLAMEPDEFGETVLAGENRTGAEHVSGDNSSTSTSELTWL
ncbi:unnamed protein product [Amoebophrya sp. A120]|nr:unnamed protein product [Amoebophrya sp. A120]|eukprot:GSA120T00007175001.1